jgi:hypothetical protein
MLSYPVILAIGIVGLVVIAGVSFFSSGFLSLLVVLALAGLIYVLLHSFGVLDVTFKNGLEIDFHENAPAPHAKHPKHKAIETKEVFFVDGNQFTYNDASAVCAAYGSELATYDQLADAFAKGAEWCGYGWSQGGMALFPTQESTWAAMQQEVDETKRTACGRPGVNGGYFDPTMKFGVNCYGSKPSNKGFKLPAPLPGTDPSTFDKMVNKWKSMLGSLKLTPFNRDVWSASGELKFEAQQAKKKAGSYIGTLEKDFSNLGSEIENAF